MGNINKVMRDRHLEEERTLVDLSDDSVVSNWNYINTYPLDLLIKKLELNHRIKLKEINSISNNNC